MKPISKTIVIICVLIVSMTVATACNGSNCLKTIPANTTASLTVNSGGLPSQSDVMQAVSEAKTSTTSGSFAEAMMKTIKANHSSWKADTWTSGSSEVISIYDDEGGLYFDDNGNQITPSTSFVLKESYKGSESSTNESSGTETSANTSESTSTLIITSISDNNSESEQIPAIEHVTESTNSTCPTCGLSTSTAKNDTTGSLVKIVPANTSTSLTVDNTTLAQIKNGQTLTVEQQQELEEFMNYFNGTQNLTRDGIREHAIQCFFKGV